MTTKNNKTTDSTVVSASSAMMDEILGRTTIVGSPGNDDVCFGRGGFSNRHAGNQAYLKLLREHETAYTNCKRKYQKLLSLCIIHQLRVKGGRFLKKNEKSGTWSTVKLAQCRLKISQRLRERSPTIKMEERTKEGTSPSSLVIHPRGGAVKPATPVSDASSDEDNARDDDMSEPSLEEMFHAVFGYRPGDEAATPSSSETQERPSKRTACHDVDEWSVPEHATKRARENVSLHESVSKPASVAQDLDSLLVEAIPDDVSLFSDVCQAECNENQALLADTVDPPFPAFIDCDAVSFGVFC